MVESKIQASSFMASLSTDLMGDSRQTPISHDDTRQGDTMVACDAQPRAMAIGPSEKLRQIVVGAPRPSVSGACVTRSTDVLSGK